MTTKERDALAWLWVFVFGGSLALAFATGSPILDPEGDYSRIFTDSSVAASLFGALIGRWLVLAVIQVLTWPVIVVTVPLAMVCIVPQWRRRLLALIAR